MRNLLIALTLISLISCKKEKEEQQTNNTVSRLVGMGELWVYKGDLCGYYFPTIKIISADSATCMRWNLRTNIAGNILTFTYPPNSIGVSYAYSYTISFGTDADTVNNVINKFDVVVLKQIAPSSELCPQDKGVEYRGNN